MRQTEQQHEDVNVKGVATKQWAIVFQKYMMIRLDEILFRKQLRIGFKQLLEIKPIQKLQPNTRSTFSTNETLYYTVQLEIIRPKIRGEVIFNKVINISDLRIPKKNENKLYISQPSDSITLFDQEKREQESNTKIQDLKQLIKLQKSMKEIPIADQKAKPRQNQIGIYPILAIVLILYILFLTF